MRTKKRRSQCTNNPRNRRRTRRRERNTASMTNLSVMNLSVTLKTTIATIWMAAMRRSSTPASDTTTLAMKMRITMDTLMMPRRQMVSVARIITLSLILTCSKSTVTSILVITTIATIQIIVLNMRNLSGLRPECTTNQNSMNTSLPLKNSANGTSITT